MDRDLWNKAAERLFGYTETEALGQSLDLMIPPRLRKGHWDGYRKTMETGITRYGTDLAGVFRYNSDSPAGQSGYQTNHRYVYLRSPDGGTSWQRSDGSPISVPVVENAAFLNLGPNHVPEIVKDLAEGHSIINESGMTTDSTGRPIIAKNAR